jgi:hypothetical protein
MLKACSFSGLGTIEKLEMKNRQIFLEALFFSYSGSANALGDITFQALYPQPLVLPVFDTQVAWDELKADAKRGSVLAKLAGASYRRPEEARGA